MSRFLSEDLKNLVPYTPGEQLAGNFIKLNTNESPFPPSSRVAESLNTVEINKLNLYSDPTADLLVSEIAKYYSVKKENVAVGNGSDEILAFAFNAFGEKGFICPEITYGFYPVFADFFGIDLETVQMEDDLSINPEKYYSSKRNIILANPNAQTGIYLDLNEIERIVRSNENKIVIIDEAYIDFGGESAVSLIDKYDNLLVVQTFSKSRNLAGGRIGFAIGNKELIADINTMKFSFNPYNVNRLSILAGSASMSDCEYFIECTKQIIENRENLIEFCHANGFIVTPSKANFILMKHPSIDGKDLYLQLKEKGILVRHLGGLISDYIRVTIGSKEQMDKFKEKTSEIIKCKIQEI
ncbi:MAG: histidinol-phosphate transaminase [Ruminococcaceae bacterium]|nr:histidinol-phosphate transaminase [Oscillospiraceae bacterium]